VNEILVSSQYLTFKIMMIKSIVLQELSSGENYTMELPFIIGRDKEADLVLSDLTISHRHALVSEIDNGIFIQDLDSANGVFVNNLRIRDKTRLKPGDTIKLGKTDFIVSKDEEDISEQTLILHSLPQKDSIDMDNRRLKTIYEITKELTENQDIAVLGNKIFAKFRDIFSQDRGYIATFQKNGNLKAVCSDPPLNSVPLSRSILNRLFRSGESFLLEDALCDASFKEQESIMALKIRCALCVPLIYHNQIYGLIYLDRNIPKAYSEDDLKFLRSIGSIIAPLLENARLWSELKNRYDNAINTLRETESQLIEAERTAAYVRLANAMAHEIRNPLTAIGGLLKRMPRPAQENPANDSIDTMISLIERVEKVLREVDSFVKIMPPKKKLQRIDLLIQEEIELHNEEWQSKALRPALSVNTPHLMAPLDAELFRKALSMIFREIIFCIPHGSDINISIHDRDNNIEIVFGETGENSHLCKPFDPELRKKPWSLGLFLNIAHKIMSDHGGAILLDPLSHSAIPIIMKLPRQDILG